MRNTFAVNQTVASAAASPTRTVSPTCLSFLPPFNTFSMMTRLAEQFPKLFVNQVLAGRNAVGRRIRYRAEDSAANKAPGPWFEIIGVVRDLVPDPEAPMSLDNPGKIVVYHTLGSSRT